MKIHTRPIAEKWRPLTFNLVVDNIGVKYVGVEHAQHLVQTGSR